MVQPDNFSLYQPLVVASLWMGARGLRGSGRSFVAAGLLAGPRHPVAERWPAGARRPRPRLRVGSLAGLAGHERPAAISWTAAIGCVAVFVLVMAPWWLRQLAVFGSLSPSTASGKVLFIRDIGEWNSITTPATLQHLLGMGLGPFLETRVGGLIAAVMIYTTLVAGFVLAPFMVIGGWARRRSLDFGPFFLYAGLLFALLDAGLGGARAGRHVHPLGGGPRAPRLHPRPRGHRRGRRPGSLRRRPRLGCRGRHAPSSRSRRSPSRSSPRPPGPLFVHRSWTRQPGQVPSRSPPPSTRPARRRPTGSCPSTLGGRQVLDRPWRRRPRQRPADTIETSRAPTTSTGSCSIARTASSRSRRSSRRRPPGLARRRRSSATATRTRSGLSRRLEAAP